MTPDQIAAFTLFAIVATATPGPNNLMALASGANFGLRRTLPHLLGIALGFGLMILLTGLGLARLMAAVPGLRGGLAAVAAVFLLYLAWRIATAAPPPIEAQTEAPTEARAGAARPLTLWEAAAFQWVNPKAWAMALTTVTVHVPPSHAALAALIFAGVALPLTGLWAVAGEALGRLLSDPRLRRGFNFTMAALLLASMAPALLAMT